MLKKRLQILSEFKTPLPLQNADVIKFVFPYENGATLEKNVVDIIDAHRGIVEISLSDFEVQGLKAEASQNFKAEIHMEGFVYTVLFAKGMTVEMQGERKVWV